MLKEYKNWLLEKNYSQLTSEDYKARIERLCHKESFSLDYLAQHIKELLPLYEKNGKKETYGRRSHCSVLASLRLFSTFLTTQTVESVN
jgi:hypothetical protein